MVLVLLPVLVGTATLGRGHELRRAFAHVRLLYGTGGEVETTIRLGTGNYVDAISAVPRLRPIECGGAL